MFDFNSHNLQSGSKIVSASGNVVFDVKKTFVPEWETPSKHYLNDCLWVQVIDNKGQQWAQPVQWFNATIGANDGMKVI